LSEGKISEDCEVKQSCAYILLKPLYFLQSIMADIELFQIDKCFETFQLGDTIGLDRKDF
jgi:hypothetical protein